MSTTLETTDADMENSPAIKRLLQQDSPTSSKQSTNKKTKTGECICPIFLDPIVGAAKSKRKCQGSIFCEG